MSVCAQYSHTGMQSGGGKKKKKYKAVCLVEHQLQISQQKLIIAAKPGYRQRTADQMAPIRLSQSNNTACVNGRKERKEENKKTDCTHTVQL